MASEELSIEIINNNDVEINNLIENRNLKNIFLLKDTNPKPIATYNTITPKDNNKK